MPEKLIRISAEWEELGEALEALVADIRGTVARTGGGKAVDYEEVETVVSADAGKVER